MKKSLLTLLLISSFFSILPRLRAQTFSGGDGTISNPYQISTKAELLQVKDYPNEAYALLNDIDFTGDGAYNYSILGNFSGKFDGLGYYISNLTLEGSISFFGSVTATGKVKNLHIKNLTFTGYLYSNGSTNSKNQYHAPFAYTNDGEIENCSYVGDVHAYAYLAGFVLTNNGTIKNCYSNANVIADDGMNISNNWFPGKYGGGFVRLNNTSGIIINCYSTGTVTVGDLGAAGFTHTNSGQISNCFSFDTSIRSTWYGSIVHRFANSNTGSLSNISARETMTLNGATTTSNDATSIEGADIAEDDIKVQSTYTSLGWDFTQNWKLESGDAYPQLRILPDCPVITLTGLSSSSCEDYVFTETISASGGAGSYEYALYSGSLPIGISISTTGVTSGTPTSSGTFNFTISATDENGCTGTKDYTFTILPHITATRIESICPGGSFTFGSQTLTSAGEYTETFTSVAGCDSTVTLTLNMNPIYSETKTVTICENGFPYSFGTQSITSTGEYTETFTSVAGCDSTVILTLNVNPVYNVSKTVAICENEFPYSFGTQSITSAGEYTETFTSVAGCDSTVTLTLNINPAYNETKTVAICESGFPYAFGTQSITSAGEYTETFSSVLGCDSTVTLTLNVNPAYDVMYSDESSSTTPLINDNFENEVVGSKPTDWIKLYNGTGDANQIVVNSIAKNGSNSFQLEGASSWAAEYYQSISGTHEKLTVEAWINVEKTLSGITGGIGLADKSAGMWGTRTSRLEFYNGRIRAIYTGGTAYDIQSFTPGVWYHIRMEHDLVARTYSIFINGVKVSGISGSLTTNAFPMHPTVNSKEVVLLSGNSGTVKLFFDDVKLYEPGTVNVCSSELPFLFGTQSITESGEYQEMFQTIAGCDSLVTLNLVVKPSFNISEEKTLCANELPYSFGSQSLTQSGVYSELYTAITGCDSTRMLTLTVNPIYNENAEETVFLNELPFGFGTQELTESGTYTETFQSISGCDSTVTLTLTVLDIEDIAPVAVGTPISVYLNGNGNYSLAANDIYNMTKETTDENYDYAELTFAVTPNTFNCSDAGNIQTVQIIATNPLNNRDTCYTKVWIYDNTSPSILCKDLTLELDESGQASIDVADLLVSEYDACGIEKTSLSKTNFDCENIGINQVTITSTDNNGNFNTCNSKVTVIVTNHLPTIAPIPDQTVEEDSELLSIPLAGISYGNDCEKQTISISASATKNTLISEIKTSYTDGETTGLLEITIPPNAFGVTDITIQVTDSEEGTFAQTFNLAITPVNDAPIVFNNFEVIHMRTMDTLNLVISPEKGIWFDDPDPDNTLQIQVKSLSGEAMPHWIIFRNDSLIATRLRADVGCIDLQVLASDSEGLYATSKFTLCAEFPVSTKNMEDQLHSVQFFPNPTSGMVYLRIPPGLSENYTIVLSDNTGRQILCKEFKQTESCSVDLSFCSNGVYILQFYSANAEFRQKIIIRK